jgi:hypothetical protein
MRILVADQPQLTRECLASVLSKHPGMNVEIADANEVAILRHVRHHRQDFIILSLDVMEARPLLCRVLLTQAPRTVIIAAGSKRLAVYWFDITLRRKALPNTLGTVLDLLKIDRPGFVCSGALEAESGCSAVLEICTRDQPVNEPGQNGGVHVNWSQEDIR